MERFRNSIRKMWSVWAKIALFEKYFERKNSQKAFLLFVLIYPLLKFGGNRTNSLWVLAFYSVRFKWKSWCEKTTLNMSIRRVIFTSCQNLKPLFLCQYLKEHVGMTRQSDSSIVFRWKKPVKFACALHSVPLTGSRQNLKPPFLCQYLIFFNDFFFTLKISFGSLL